MYKINLIKTTINEMATDSLLLGRNDAQKWSVPDYTFVLIDIRCTNRANNNRQNNDNKCRSNLFDYVPT